MPCVHTNWSSLEAFIATSPRRRTNHAVSGKACEGCKGESANLEWNFLSEEIVLHLQNIHIS